MALALRAIHREPPPDPRAAGVRLTSDFASVLSESQRAARAIGIQRAIVEDIRAQKTWQWALADPRRRYHRVRALRSGASAACCAGLRGTLAGGRPVGAARRDVAEEVAHQRRPHA